ncbi:MAG: SpoVG family protein [Clostridiales bacterium]|nr:SpoVG family protein [Clostridiales bacterium]
MHQVGGVNIITSAADLFVTMPQSKDKNGDFHDIAFPVNSDLRKELNNAVLAEYDEPTRGADGKNIGRSVAAPVNMEPGDRLSVKVYPINKPQGNTVAFANVGIETLVAISGIRVVSGKNGLFVNMPQNKDKNDEYRDIAFPINSELRKEVNKEVLGAYKELQAKKDLPADGF